MLRESIAAVESLMAIGLDQIEQVDADLRHAVVLCGPRRMPVRLHVGSPVSVQSALPVPFAAVNDPCDLLDSLNSLVQRLEPFWKRFDALDANTRVLDPVPARPFHRHCLFCVVNSSGNSLKAGTELYHLVPISR